LDKVGTEHVEKYTFSYGKGTENYQLGTGFCVHERIVLAVKRVEFFSCRISYIALRGCWCDIIGQNANVPTEDKSDNN
jgi:hypothetical protein